RLLQGLETSAPVGSADPEIRALASDSREVREGTLFVCLAGERADGHLFAKEALARGAAAVLAERPLDLGDAPLVLVPSTRRALAELALRMEENPQDRLRLV